MLQFGPNSQDKNLIKIPTKISLSWPTRHTWQIILLQRRQSLLLSASHSLTPPTPPPQKLHKSPLSSAVGAVVIAGEGEEGAVEILPTEGIVIIKTKIHPTLPLLHPTNPTKRGQSIVTYPPVQPGRARSTGRKGGGRLIAVTRWCVSGAK